jgi:hypothetical protein
MIHFGIWTVRGGYHASYFEQCKLLITVPMYLLKHTDKPRRKWRLRAWNEENSMRGNNFLWKIQQRANLNKAKLERYGTNDDVMCSFCHDIVVSAVYLLFESKDVIQLWYSVMATLGSVNISYDKQKKWNIIRAKRGCREQFRSYFHAVMKRLFAEAWRESKSRVYVKDNRKAEFFMKNWVVHVTSDSLELLPFAFALGINQTL